MLSNTDILPLYECFNLAARFNLKEVEKEFRPAVLNRYSQYIVETVPGTELTYFDQLALYSPLKATELARDGYDLLKQRLQVSLTGNSIRSDREQDLLNRLSRMGSELAQFKKNVGVRQSRRRR
jgi:hypothetical protein